MRTRAILLDFLFLAVDELGRRHGANYWKSQAGALTCPVTVNDKPVLLVKPQTFMNLSGVTVARLADEFEIDSEHILVIHDDLDIEKGHLKHK